MTHTFRMKFLSLAIAVGFASPVLAVDYTWVGGVGNWTNPGLWGAATFPNAATDNAFIDGGKTGIDSFVTLAGIISIGTVTVDLGDTLRIADNSLLNTYSGLTNNGRVELNSAGNATVIRVADNTTFGGTGTLVMSAVGNNHIQSFVGQNNRLTNAADHTIEGAGNIGGNAMKFTNAGTVNANVAAPLVIDVLNGTNFETSGMVNVATGSQMVIVDPIANTGDIVVGGLLTLSPGMSLMQAAGGHLSGNGTINGSVMNTAGVVAPGATLGTLTIGNFVQGSAGTLNIDLGNLASHDLLLATGTASLDGTLALSCFGACSFTTGDEFVILDSTGNLSGEFFGGVTLSGFATGAFNVVYDTSLDEVRLQVLEDVTAVPEPETWAMLLAGLGLVGFAAQRRKVRLAV